MQRSHVVFSSNRPYKWAVMGPCSDGGRRSLLLLLSVAAALLRCCSASAADDTVCKSKLCSMQYSQALEVNEVTNGPTYKYCVILRSYLECIRSSSRACRGDLEYHTIKTMIVKWNNNYNCTYIIAQGPPKDDEDYAFVNVFPQVPVRPKPRPSSSTECTSYRSAGGNAKFTQCGLFGDPHLRTFYSDLQTCRVLGAWPLIDNPHVAVQVTNDAVMKGSSATATSKVTVIVRHYRPCAVEKMYEAQTDYLPGYFTDGTRASGPGVRIREVVPDRHVEIILRYIATKIIIRQVGRYLTFAVQMPQEIAVQSAQEDSLDLCLKGCPRREKIDFSQLLSQPGEVISLVTGRGHVAMPKEEAVATCREYNVTDFFFDACVFDLLTTGDTTFSLAAREAMRDSQALKPSMRKSQQNRTPYTIPGDEKRMETDSVVENSAPGRPSLQILVLVVLMLHIVVQR